MQSNIQQSHIRSSSFMSKPTPSVFVQPDDLSQLIANINQCESIDRVAALMDQYRKTKPEVYQKHITRIESMTRLMTEVSNENYLLVLLAHTTVAKASLRPLVESRISSEFLMLRKEMNEMSTVPDIETRRKQASANLKKMQLTVNQYLVAFNKKLTPDVSILWLSLLPMDPNGQLDQGIYRYLKSSIIDQQTPINIQLLYGFGGAELSGSCNLILILNIMPQDDKFLAEELARFFISQKGYQPGRVLQSFTLKYRSVRFNNIVKETIKYLVTKGNLSSVMDIHQKFVIPVILSDLPKDILFSSCDKLIRQMLSQQLNLSGTLNLELANWLLKNTNKTNEKQYLLLLHQIFRRCLPVERTKQYCDAVEMMLRKKTDMAASKHMQKTELKQEEKIKNSEMNDAQVASSAPSSYNQEAILSKVMGSVMPNEMSFTNGSFMPLQSRIAGVQNGVQNDVNNESMMSVAQKNVALVFNGSFMPNPNGNAPNGPSPQSGPVQNTPNPNSPNPITAPTPPQTLNQPTNQPTNQSVFHTTNQTLTHNPSVYQNTSTIHKPTTPSASNIYNQPSIYHQPTPYQSTTPYPETIVQQTLKHNKQYIGLPNIGNTCYINSMLLSLFFCQKFQSQFMLVQTNDLVIRYIQLIYDKILKRDATCLREYMLELKKTLPGDYSKDSSQQDVMEFGRYLIDKIVNLNVRMKSIFEIKQIETIMCPKGDPIERRQCSEYFMLLRFPSSKGLEVEGQQIQPHHDMMKLMAKQRSRRCRDFFQNALIEGSFTCEVCKTAYDRRVRKTRFLAMPQILIVVLGRFSYDAQLATKICDGVKFDNFIDFGPLISQNTRQHYMLKAFINHMGRTADSGHYQAYVRHPKQQTKWLNFDDDFVTESFYKKVADMVVNLNQYDSPYVLFYEKI